VQPYNPLDKRNLALSVTNELLRHPLLPLSQPTFEGAGIYALYCVGTQSSFPLYQRLAEPTAPPIYVGKAVPAGARVGGIGFDAGHGLALSSRLRDHAASINDVTNLALADFVCRYLIVDDIWIPLGESLLIEMFRPLWNTTITSFGNHDPGAGRYNQQRSFWDTLHPGRVWAERLQPNRLSYETIWQRAVDYVDA
jgi:hypothetical protein